MPIYREGIDLDQYVSTWDEPDSVEGLGYCYRYTDVKYSPGVDEWDDPLPRSPGTHLGIHVHEYKVLRETKCGFWFYDTYEGRERFINNSWTKKHALRSKEAARDSYIARKENRLRCSSARSSTPRSSCAWPVTNKRAASPNLSGGNMGLEYYALNHARAEAVSLGRLGFRFDALLNVTDQAEFERACFESLVASGFDYARAAEFAHDFYDFGADEIWNDGQDVYEYFSCYRVVDALDHEEIGSKLGDYFVRSGMLPVEALSLRHPRVRIVLGRAQITQPNLN